MKKNMLFLSAALTTFILAILAGVVFKARANALLSPTGTVVPTDISTPVASQPPQPAATATMAPTIAAFISPQEAVFIASSALGNSDVFSVDSETRYGLDVYKVTFSSGSIVFVSPQGHILTITAIPPVVINQDPVQPASNQKSSNQSSNNQPAGNQQTSPQQPDDQKSDDHQPSITAAPVPVTPPAFETEDHAEESGGDD
jgi:hypothetical protein